MLGSPETKAEKSKKMTKRSKIRKGGNRAEEKYL